MRAECRETGEENIDGDLEAGLCEGEYVFWGRKEERFNEEGDAAYGENEEGSVDCWRYGLNRQAVYCWPGTKRAVVRYGLGEKDRAKENEEGPDSIGH